MKQLAISFFCLIFSFSAFAQQLNTDQPVYLRFPTVPAFTVYQVPDSTAFSRENLKKKKPVMFFIFSPECGHCKHSTEMLIKNMDKLKDVQIVMVSYLPYNEIKSFYNAYNLGRFSNITVARDAKFFFPTFFHVRNFPSYYFYDKKGDFKKFLEGDVKMDSINAALKL